MHVFSSGLLMHACMSSTWLPTLVVVRRVYTPFGPEQDWDYSFTCHCFCSQLLFSIPKSYSVSALGSSCVKFGYLIFILYFNFGFAFCKAVLLSKFTVLMGRVFNIYIYTFIHFYFIYLFNFYFYFYLIIIYLFFFLIAMCYVVFFALALSL